MAKKFFLQLKLDEEDHEQVLRTRYEAFLKLFQAQTGESKARSFFRRKNDRLSHLYL